LQFLSAPERQIQIRLFDLLRFLDEAVQQNHLPINNRKYYSGNAITREIAAHLPKSVGKGSTMRPADWPSEFNFLNILADGAAVICFESQKPRSNRPVAGCAFLNRATSFLLRSIIRNECAIFGTYRQGL
jgi:hypothetical protein